MATRVNIPASGLPGMDENGPRKVSAKIIQGAVPRRAALGDVRNRPIQPRVPTKAELLKKTVPSKVSLVKPKSTVGSRKEDKENEGVVVRMPKENVVEEMEIQEEVGEVAKVEELAVAFSTQLLNVEDIDSQDKDNPQLVSEYVNDIYSYLRELENKSPVKTKYLDGQDISGKMRTILVDWLVQVHLRFAMLQETLYLTIAILDRYLQVERTTPRNKLQLVGVTAMFIASKYEEMYCPEIGDFSYITDKAYTKLEIRRMEVKMLKALDYCVSYPLPLHFLRRCSKAGSVDAQQHTLAKYFMEICLPDYSMVYHKPSIIAAAALCLSLKLLDNENWNDTLVYYSRYTEEQLLPVMAEIATVVVKSTTAKQQAVRQKYKGSKFMKISDIPQLKSPIILSLAKNGTYK